MKFIRDTIITFSTRVITIALGMVAAIVVARVLGPEGKGAYALVILFPTMLTLIGDLGLGIANVYFGSSKRYRWADLASNSLISALGLGIILAVIFLASFLVLQPTFLKDISSGWMLVAVLVVPLSLLTTYFQSILLGQNRIRDYNLVSLAQAGTYLMLILFLILGLGGGVFSAILAWASAFIVTAIFSILLVRKSTAIGFIFHPLIFKDSVKFGVKGYLGNLVQFSNYRLDMFLIAFFMNVTSVGYYSIAVTMAEVLWYFPGAVGTIIYARTPILSAEDANASTPRICRNTLFLTILAALVMFALGKPIIALFFGSAFLPALKPFWILLPGVVALSIDMVLGNEITGRGKPLIGTIVAGVSLIVNIPMNIILIPRMGIAGAALASTVAYVVDAIVVTIIFLKMSKNSWVDTLVLKRDDLSIYTNALSSIRSFVVKGEASRFLVGFVSSMNPWVWKQGLFTRQNADARTTETAFWQEEEPNESSGICNNKDLEIKK